MRLGRSPSRGPGATRAPCPHAPAPARAFLCVRVPGLSAHSPALQGCGGGLSCSMNLRLCVQALLLLWLSLTAVCGGECVPSCSPWLPPGLSRGAAYAFLSFRPTRALPASRETRCERCRSSHAPATPGGLLTGHLGPRGDMPCRLCFLGTARGGFVITLYVTT